MKPTKEEILSKYSGWPIELLNPKSKGLVISFSSALKAMDEYAKIDWDELRKKWLESGNAAFLLNLHIDEKGIFNWFKNEIEK